MQFPVITIPSLRINILVKCRCNHLYQLYRQLLHLVKKVGRAFQTFFTNRAIFLTILGNKLAPFLAQVLHFFIKLIFFFADEFVFDTRECEIFPNLFF
jgi:hypothetical protein